jgi:hypothetical protein
MYLLRAWTVGTAVSVQAQKCIHTGLLNNINIYNHLQFVVLLTL